ncbi:hypothetical protein [Phosphitispora fastidiosa]|uniref:hypothetical protein n=1 Tax=Phosphitispora fastidiosa TaxID=2837202 RepID=UPI001E492921|nr:hypothetical protein [Phosphitispora fastidiosa]MBU7008699.1 hypothetical protein [Phosphitispora fastidiosa]
MENTDRFLVRIRLELENSQTAGNNGYIDLAKLEAVPSPQELLSPVAPPGGLSGFQEIMMEEIAKCHLDKIKTGINELLKYLLARINVENEEPMAELYMYRLRMIFSRCLMPDFPFTEEVWNYICEGLRTVGSFLVQNGFYDACREIIDSTAGMGRIAALKGLPTGNTQSSLRILENKALENGEKSLASAAKNARFNLET